MPRGGARPGAGRPKTLRDSQRRVGLTVTIRTETIDLVKAIAENIGTTPSRLVEDLIAEALDHEPWKSAIAALDTLP